MLESNLGMTELAELLSAQGSRDKVGGLLLQCSGSMLLARVADSAVCRCYKASDNLRSVYLQRVLPCLAVCSCTCTQHCPFMMFVGSRRWKR